jgi:hypothetical protein
MVAWVGAFWLTYGIGVAPGMHSHYTSQYEVGSCFFTVFY